MRGGLWYNVRMKAVYWLPAAALAGFIAGGWGAREELRALRELSESDEAKAVAKSKPDGFDAFASIMRIPDEAKRLPSRKEKGKASRNAIGDEPCPVRGDAACRSAHQTGGDEPHDGGDAAHASGGSPGPH